MLTGFFDFLRFLQAAMRAYRGAKRAGSYYVGLYPNGPSSVCDCAIFVGLGREAWRVSQRAIEEFQLHQTR